jgi:energy-coupling factor transport system ATP-binding protein
LAAALAHGPAVLALDEPTVGQDRATWAAVAGLLLAARRAGVGVLLATHDSRLVACLDPDRSYRLDDGRIVATATDPVAAGRGPSAAGPGAGGLAAVPPGAARREVTGDRD